MIVSFLIFVIVLLLVLWAVKSLMAAFAIDEPIRTVVWVVVVILAVILIASNLPGEGLNLRIR